MESGLNPSEKAFVELWNAQKLAHPGKALSELTIDDLRANTSGFLKYAEKATEVEYIDKESLTRDGFSIRIRIYNNQYHKKTPVLIFYPGCAFVFDLFEVNAMICSRIARSADIKVILVQFRLAPEYPMPTSIYDGYDAAAYIASHPENFGIDPNKIFLGGWCSGAQCATAVSGLLRQNKQLKVYHQILLGGSFDLTESTRHFDDYEQEDKILSRKFIGHIANKYYGSTEYQNPLISPFSPILRVCRQPQFCAENMMPYAMIQRDIFAS